MSGLEQAAERGRNVGKHGRVGTIQECPRCHGTLRVPVKRFFDKTSAGDGPCPDCMNRLSLCGVVIYSSWHEPVACAFFPGHDGDHSWATIPCFDPRTK